MDGYVQPQRLQHAGQYRLPSGAVNGLAGAARLARFGRSTQRAFDFVVRAGHRLAVPVRLLRRLGRHERKELVVLIVRILQCQLDGLAYQVSPALCAALKFA